MYNFPVMVSQDEDGMYIAKVPDLQGCHTQARTLVVLYKRIEEAIELCLEIEKEKEHAIPQGKFIGVHQVEVSA